MSEQQTNQPEGKPPMSMKLSGDNSITKKVGKEVLKEGVDQGKDQIVEYEKDNGQEQMNDPQQRLDDAKAQAEGMWAKYCGCFASAA